MKDPTYTTKTEIAINILKSTGEFLKIIKHDIYQNNAYLTPI